MVSGENKKIRLCVIYLPPPSKTNNFRNSVFFDEWSDFLDQVVVIPDELIITGDLNFHLDDTNDGDARKFIQSLEDHGFIQNVTGPTHKHGHTLDVLITRENSSILLGQPITHDPTLFDQKGISTCHHLAISSRLQLSKHPKKREKVTFRKFRDISKTDFIQDVENSPGFQNPKGPVDDLVTTYVSDFSTIIDNRAPLQSKEVKIRPNTELRAAKRERRKAECTMRKTKLTIHKEIYQEQCSISNRLLHKCKKDLFSNKIAEVGSDLKPPYRLTNVLMGNKREVILPSYHSEQQLTNTFGEIFMGKIEMIRNNVCASGDMENCDILRADIRFEGVPLTNFSPASIDEIRKIIQRALSNHVNLTRFLHIF